MPRTNQPLKSPDRPPPPRNSPGRLAPNSATGAIWHASCNRFGAPACFFRTLRKCLWHFYKIGRTTTVGEAQ
jgi:hypothetical protein